MGLHSGAGIGGLMLTVALQHMDKAKKLDIHVYEAAPALGEIGAGINLWLRSWEIMKAIGLEETFVNMMDEAPTDEARSYPSSHYPLCVCSLDPRSCV